MEKKILFHKIGWNLMLGSLIAFFASLFLSFLLDINITNSPQKESEVIAMIFILGFFSWSYSRYLYSKKNEKKRKNKL